jgi:hypothetical protein
VGKLRTWGLQPPRVVNTKTPVAVTDSRDSTKRMPRPSTILGKPNHQPHLENFFEAVRANDKALLNCPARKPSNLCPVLRVNKG